MPCQELFDKQSKDYKEKIFEKNSLKISIEASSVSGWEKYVGQNGYFFRNEIFWKKCSN